MLPLLTTLPLVLSAASSPCGRVDDWIPLDGPDGARLPPALRELPQRVGQAYEAKEGGMLLIARHLACGDLVDAFMSDEELVATSSTLIPLGEQVLESDVGDVLVFECEVAFDGVAGRLAALYAPIAPDETLALWMLAPGTPSFAELEEALAELLPRFLATVEPPHDPRQRAILREHLVTFATSGAEGDEPLALLPVPDVRDADFAFHDKEMKGHPAFEGDCIRQWEDAARGVTLSFQVLQGDRSIGPKEPLVYHIAEELQAHVQVSKEAGDVPIELIHLPGARTVVLSPAQVEQHYANNRNAPEAGVILKTFIPQSPFARATRLRWREGEGDSLEHVLALYIELRSYPQSRSETITRCAVVILQARAHAAQDLASLEQGLAYESRPLDRPAPFAPGS